MLLSAMKPALASLGAAFLLCSFLSLVLSACANKPSAPAAPIVGDPVAMDTIYVPIEPAWGGFSKPEDVLAGREPFIYVADTQNDRVAMLDLAGRVVGYSKPIRRPVALAQDYRFRLLVAGELDTTIQGRATTIGAVYRIDLAATQHAIAAAPMELMWAEPSKPNRRFTGVAALPDNGFLVARVGPLNTSAVDPDNSVLEISQNGTLISPVGAVAPVGNAIGSIAGLTSILTQENGRSFSITQSDPGQQFRFQSFTYSSSSKGEGWQPTFPPQFQLGDLMNIERFTQPEDAAQDRFGNIYVVDAGRDSVYKFNSKGMEFRGQSFGGAAVLKNPHGVAHHDRTLYVADTDNNRIVRFRLTTEN